MVFRRIIPPSLLLTLAGAAAGQCTPAWSTFFPGPDFPDYRGGILRLLPHDDGLGGGLALYGGGDLFRVGGIEALGIAAWNGQTWAPLGAGLSGGSPLIRDMTVWDPDGDGPQRPLLCVTGLIGSAGGAPGGNIAAWDGVSWSFVGVGQSTSVNGVAIAAFDEDGPGPNPPALFVGGRVELPGGVSMTGISRWNGSAWSAVGGGVGGFTSNQVNALQVHDPDGAGPLAPRLYVGGRFLTAGGNPAPYIASWDGSAWAPLGVGTDNTVNLIRSIDEDGPQPAVLYVAGTFNQAGGIAAPHMARWDGASWSALGTGLTGNPQDFAAFDPDGVGPAPTGVYACGYDLLIDGLSAHGIARWNGAAWSPVGSGLAMSNLSPSAGASALAVFDPDGSGPLTPRLYITGSFNFAGGVASNGIATFDGAAWVALGPHGSPHRVNAMAAVLDRASAAPDLFVGGEFTVLGGLAASHIARWNGLGWLQLGAGVDGPVHAVSPYDADGPGPAPESAVVAGAFTRAGGAPAANIARWSASTWLPLGSGIAGTVRSLALFDEDGAGPGLAALFAGGFFSQAGGGSASNVARWNGAGWSAVGAGADGPVYALLAADLDGPGPGAARLYIAGSFQQAGGAPAASLARWDGVAWSSLGSGIAGTVYALAAVPPGSALAAGLYVGGSFTDAGGVPAANVARWDGSSWFAIAGGGTDGPVLTLSAHDDDRNGTPCLFVGGAFSHAAGLPIAGLARFDGAAWADLGARAGVYTLASFDDTQHLAAPVLFAGGDFDGAGTVQLHSLARWGCPPASSCYANCDASTTPPVLNVLDFACFLGRFAAASTYANCDGSTNPPVLNVLDFGCYLNRFVAGCT